MAHPTLLQSDPDSIVIFVIGGYAFLKSRKTTLRKQSSNHDTYDFQRLAHNYPLLWWFVGMAGFSGNNAQFYETLTFPLVLLFRTGQYS